MEIGADFVVAGEIAPPELLRERDEDLLFRIDAGTQRSTSRNFGVAGHIPSANFRK
jgi:hypothetical protein